MIKQYFYEEVETEGLFEPINPNEKSSTKPLEKIKILNKELRVVKREHEIQSMRLCKVSKERKMKKTRL